MSAGIRSNQAPATSAERVAAFGAPALLASGVVAALGTVFLFLTFATQASTIMEPVTELSPPDRAANALTGLSMLVAIPAAFRLHQSWRIRAPGASSAALAIGVVSLLAYGLLLLLVAGEFVRFRDASVATVVLLGGIGVWWFLVSAGRADPALGGIVRWLGVAIGVGNVLLVVGFFGGGGSGAITDPNVVLQSPLLLVGAIASLFGGAIGYPIWAIWLGRRLAAGGRPDSIPAKR